MKAMGATSIVLNVSPKSSAGHYSWDPSSHPLILDGYIIDSLRSGRKVKITREFEQRILKKATMVERSPAPILLLKAAALLKPFGEFIDAVDIERRSQQRSLVFHKR